MTSLSNTESNCILKGIVIGFIITIGFGILFLLEMIYKQALKIGLA